MEKICTKCKTLKNNFGKNSASADGFMYACKDCHNEYSKKYHKNHLQEQKIRCEQWREDNKQHVDAYRKKHYWENKDKRDLKKAREDGRRYFKKLKAEIIREYGGKCTCCGEEEMDFLTLEHSRHDGKQHRLAVKTSIYNDLKRRGYPKDLGITVFCWNCQMATRFGAVCPHKRGDKNAVDLGRTSFGSK